MAPGAINVAKLAFVTLLTSSQGGNYGMYVRQVQQSINTKVYKMNEFFIVGWKLGKPIEFPWNSKKSYSIAYLGWCCESLSLELHNWLVSDLTQDGETKDKLKALNTVVKEVGN